MASQLAAITHPFSASVGNLAQIVVLWRRRNRGDEMLIFELEGWQGVENYAKSNRIPLDVCRKIISDYLATDRGGFMR
jgi:hypothetical protein